MPLRIGLIAAILLGSAGAAWTLKPTFAVAAANPNVDSIDIVLSGPNAGIMQILFAQGSHNGTRVEVSATNATSLTVKVQGPTIFAQTPIATPPPQCRAIFGTCRATPLPVPAPLTGDPTIRTSGYEASRASAHVERMLVVSFEIPHWYQYGPVVDEEQGTVAVVTPSIQVYGDPPPAYSVEVSVAGSVDHDLTNAEWSSSPPDNTFRGEADWNLRVTHMTDSRGVSIKPLSVTGTIPQEQSKNAWDTFLAGILIGVAAAAFMALVSEIRARDGQAPEPLSSSPRSTGPPRSARRPSIRMHRAARLRRRP